MKEYDWVVIGSGSALSVVDALLRKDPSLRVAVIDKDAPGGICLTRGCIPSKILLASADVARTVERAREFGVEVPKARVHFDEVMARMHRLIDGEIDAIREGLSHAPGIDYYPQAAEFVAPKTLRVGSQTIRGRRILLGAGSRPRIPPIPGLVESGFLTSDTVLSLTRMPSRLAILGGGYIAAEYTHFFSAMGCEVTVIGRNPSFLPREDPEVSSLVAKSLGTRARLLLGHEVTEIRRSRGQRTLRISPRHGDHPVDLSVEEILVATGRTSLSDLLHPERAGIDTDGEGWIRVNEFLETSQPDVWALGDATGHALFKHRANHDASVLAHNLLSGTRHPVDYHAIPHAVFTEPEVGSVGLTEPEARNLLGPEHLLVGRYEYRHTAKGEALGVEVGMVKVIVERETLSLRGAHVVGPEASVLVQELVNLMYTPGQTVRPILDAMYIHPALSEVVQRAVLSLRPLEGTPSHSRPP